MNSLFLCWNSPTVDVFDGPLTDDYLTECFQIATTAAAIVQRSVMMAFAELARRTKLPPVAPPKPKPVPAPKPAAKKPRAKRSRCVK